VAFFIHFGSLGATLVPSEHWWAILQSIGRLGGYFIFFSFFFHFLEMKSDIGERSLHSFDFKIFAKHLLAFRGKNFLGVET
jgi:hypothetical protein